MTDIKNRFYFYMTIDNIEVNLSQVELVEAVLRSNRIFSVPIAELKIADKIKYFNDYPITDGQVINISVAKDRESPSALKVYSFRVFKVSTDKKSNSILYNISCVSNCPKYFNESSTLSYKGNVSDVARSVASDCGLESEVDNSSDSQNWYVGGRKRYLFFGDAVKHSYLNSTSCFIHGVTLDGTLKLKNISDLDFTKSTNILIKGPKTSKEVKFVSVDKEVSNSGILNNAAGYRYLSVRQNVDGNTTYDSVEAPVKSPVLNINSFLNDKLEESYLDIFPVDCYNTHPNYVLAYHQNKRIKATFGQSTLVALNEESDIDLYDTCKYISFENTNNLVKINSKISGGYIVTAKTIKITGGNYFEKLQLTRQGYNLDVITKNDRKLLGI